MRVRATASLAVSVALLLGVALTAVPSSAGSRLPRHAVALLKARTDSGPCGVPVGSPLLLHVPVQPVVHRGRLGRAGSVPARDRPQRPAGGGEPGEAGRHQGQALRPAELRPGLLGEDCRCPPSDSRSRRCTSARTATCTPCSPATRRTSASAPDSSSDKVQKFGPDLSNLGTAKITSEAADSHGVWRLARWGQSSMLLRGSLLILHTSRTIYAGSDGVHHEVDLTVAIDTPR